MSLTSFTYSRGTHKQIFICLHGSLEQLALDAVQGFEPFKSSLGILWQFLNCTKHLMKE